LLYPSAEPKRGRQLLTDLDEVRAPERKTTMKLNGKMMVTVAMMLGAMAVGTGCNSAAADTTSNAIAPEETAATAPVDNDTKAGAGFEQDSVYVRFGGPHYYAPHAPPAARVEVIGRAPSARHFWAPGYYRWNGREHVWVGGRWEMRRDGYEYASPHWVHRSSRWEYIPGRWVRR
jgi:hypothetical protein